jgi:hypothetical protein
MSGVKSVRILDPLESSNSQMESHSIFHPLNQNNQKNQSNLKKIIRVEKNEENSNLELSEINLKVQDLQKPVPILRDEKKSNSVKYTGLVRNKSEILKKIKKDRRISRDRIFYFKNFNQIQLNQVNLQNQIAENLNNYNSTNNLHPHNLSPKTLKKSNDKLFSRSKNRHNSLSNPRVNIPDIFSQAHDIELNIDRRNYKEKTGKESTYLGNTQTMTTGFYNPQGQLNPDLRRRPSYFYTPSNTSLAIDRLSLSIEEDEEPDSYSQQDMQQVENYFQNSKDKVLYCDICFQDIKDKFTLACGDFFCRECIVGHVTSCLNNITHLKNLRCPKSICNEKIKEGVLEKLISKNDYEKYLKIRHRIDGLYCSLNFSCPIPDCESYGYITEIKNGNLNCLNGHYFCVKCLKESHKGKPCLIEQDESEKFLKNDKFIKKCPNCKTWIEKFQPHGCNNVTCANIWCSLTFCWICMRPYDKNHYINPLSTCFGMQEIKNDSHFAKHKCLRITKCFIIFVLMLAILPFIILLFSFVFITFYILAFVLDGSAVKNLKLKTERRHKIFRFLIYATYIVISLPSLPLGYWSLAIGIVSSPFIYIYKKCKRINSQEQETEE